MNDKHTSLANVLFPKVRQQVLRLLFIQTNHSYYINEIIRLTGSGTGAVQRELEKLVSSGLVDIEIVGKQKRYKVNTTSPVYEELRSIILKTFGLADVIRDALEPVTKEINLAFIYGSVAREEDTANSDIDLMLISDTLSYAEIFPLLETCNKQIGREVNPTFYSAQEWAEKRNKSNNFIKKVLEEPKIFLIGTEDELKQLG